MPQKWEFDAKATKSIVNQYTKGGPGNGMQAFAKEYGVSLGTIRRVLVENGVEIRGRGRPRKDEQPDQAPPRKKSRKARKSTPPVPSRK